MAKHGMAFLCPTLPRVGTHQSRARRICTLRARPHLLTRTPPRSAIQPPPTQLYEDYNRLLTPSRDRFVRRAWARELRKPEKEHDIFLAFILYFCARGPRYTKPEAEWFTAAQRRCEQIGMYEFARRLVERREEESDHYVMYETDARKLANRWNAAYPQRPVNADLLLREGFLNPGEQMYNGIHDVLGETNEPYIMFAMLHEIERLSVAVGPWVLAEAVQVLGEDILKDLSFLTSHVELDAGHMEECKTDLTRVLELYPGGVERLVEVGNNILEAFGMLLDDSLVLAYGLVTEARWEKV